VLKLVLCDTIENRQWIEEETFREIDKELKSFERLDSVAQEEIMVYAIHKKYAKIQNIVPTKDMNIVLDYTEYCETFVHISDRFELSHLLFAEVCWRTGNLVKFNDLASYFFKCCQQ
jgi:hypothetical protein